MAEAILKYDLNDSDDAMAHMRAIKSLDMALALWELLNNSKRTLEREMHEKEMNKYEALDMVYERIYELMDEHNIKLDDLII
tara:strand:- start:10 stop:255 length:246 start_codon:yes stop_codon:yes gene_type:complete